MAQTPKELQLLRERLKAFAYATNVEKTSYRSCKIKLSSGDSLVLTCGNDRTKTVKAFDISSNVVTVQTHTGKPIKIARKPDQKGALMAIFKATKGKSWKRKSGWGVSRDIDNWAGITCNDQGYVTHINLANNNLKGKLPDVFYAFPKLHKLLLNKNDITGKLPRSMAWLPKKCVANIKHNKFVTTTFYVPRKRIQQVIYNIFYYPQQKQHVKNFQLFVDCDVDLNPVRGYHADNEHVLHHKATEGKGIDVYVVGDGFDEAECAVGGTAEYWLTRAADAIFNIKPYDQLKNLFNVHIIYTHSPERGISDSLNVVNSRYGFCMNKPKETPQFNTKALYDDTKESLANAGYRLTKNNPIHFIMVLNSCKRKGLHCPRTIKDGDMKRKLRVATNSLYRRGFDAVVQHEFCGHSFGELNDEYNVAMSYKSKSVNLDAENDLTKIKWAQFIADPRYASENLGAYECNRKGKTVYRATKSNIMLGSSKSKVFNAPQRLAIYKKAMKMAFPDWEYDYEEFVKFDLGDKYYPLEK